MDFTKCIDIELIFTRNHKVVLKYFNTGPNLKMKFKYVYIPIKIY